MNPDTAWTPWRFASWRRLKNESSSGDRPRAAARSQGASSPSDHFTRDLGAESVQSIELVAKFEEEFGIEMDEDAALSRRRPWASRRVHHQGVQRARRGGVTGFAARTRDVRMSQASDPKPSPVSDEGDHHADGQRNRFRWSTRPSRTCWKRPSTTACRR